MTDTPLDLDAILANAEVGRATYLPHLDQRDLRAIDRARKRATDDVLALVAALRDAQAEVEAAREAHDRAVTRGIAHVDRAEKAEAQVAAVLALADGWTLPTRKPFEPLPDPRESALSVAAVRIRAAVDGAS